MRILLGIVAGLAGVVGLLFVLGGVSAPAPPAVRTAGAGPRCGAGVFAGQRYCGNCALGLDPASIAAWHTAQMAPDPNTEPTR